MKIAVLTSSLGHSGGVRQAFYQTEELRTMGHEAILCLPHDSSLWKEWSPRPWWLRLPPEERQWRPALEAFLGEGPAILHAFHNRALKLAAWWGVRWRMRGTVCVAHRGIIIRPKNPLPYWSPGLRLFLVNSGACARSLSWYCPASKIRVVPNGIPRTRITPERPADEVRAKLGLHDTKLVLGYVGNDNPLKGTDILLKAFARAKGAAEHAVLIMVGVTPEKWRGLAAELGVAGRVRIERYVAHISDILQLCDAFLFPSRGMDSAPNVLLEAVCMGLPVVSADVGGCRDIVDGNGMLVPAGNIDALAQAISTICADDAQRTCWAAHSRLVGERYSIENRCRTLEAIYRELLGNSSSVRAEA